MTLSVFCYPNNAYIIRLDPYMLGNLSIIMFLDTKSKYIENHSTTYPHASISIYTFIFSLLRNVAGQQLIKINKQT